MRVAFAEWLEENPTELVQAFRLADTDQITPEQSQMITDWVTATIMRGPKPWPRADDPQIRMPTPRQLQVLGLMARGFTTPTIAREMGISRNTVLVHRRKLFEALGVHTAAQAVARMYRSLLSV
jgi:DNA-binding NarL/FixJ family response regulator